MDRLSLEGVTGIPQIATMHAPHLRAYIAPAHIAQGYDERRRDRPITADIFLGIKPNNVASGPHEGQDRWIWSTQESFVFSDDFTFWGTPSQGGLFMVLTQDL